MSNIKLISKKNIFFLLGIFSTCSCIALVGMGRVLSLYTITLVISFIILLTGKKVRVDIRKNKSTKLFFYWSLWGILSSAFGLLFFVENNNWLTTILAVISKIVLYFIFFSLLIKSNNRIKFCHALLKGLIFGLIINTIWATADAMIFYTFGISITNEIFRPFIVATNARHEMLSLIVGQGFIRCGGLNGDPANIGMFAPILASYSLYSKKYWLYIFVILSIFSSVSIVGLMSTLIITVLYLLYNNKSMIPIIGTSFLIISACTFLLKNENTVSIQMIEAVTSRLEDKTNSDDESTKTRSIYWFKFIPALLNTPTAFLIGTGYNTASYAYLHSGYIKSPNEPFDPEQTYFSFYFDLGLIGFLFFLFLHIYVLRISNKYKDNEDYLMIFAGIEGIMISFMGYHYTLYSVSMLFLIAGIIIIYNYKSKHPKLLLTHNI